MSPGTKPRTLVRNQSAIHRETVRRAENQRDVKLQAVQGIELPLQVARFSYAFLFKS